MKKIYTSIVMLLAMVALTFAAFSASAVAGDLPALKYKYQPLYVQHNVLGMKWVEVRAQVDYTDFEVHFTMGPSNLPDFREMMNDAKARFGNGESSFAVISLMEAYVPEYMLERYATLPKGYDEYLGIQTSAYGKRVRFNLNEFLAWVSKDQSKLALVYPAVANAVDAGVVDVKGPQGLRDQHQVAAEIRSATSGDVAGEVAGEIAGEVAGEIAAEIAADTAADVAATTAAETASTTVGSAAAAGTPAAGGATSGAGSSGGGVGGSGGD